MSAPYELFAACLPGLETLAAEELASLGGLQPTADRGGVRLKGHRKVIYRINLSAGLISHLLLRVGHFEARHFNELKRGVSQLPWRTILRPGQRIEVRATAKRSRLHHTGAIAEVLQDALSPVIGSVKDDTLPPIPIRVRLVEDRCTISVDTSGLPLHRRGYRLRTAKAPLREDLARALILTSGWDPKSALLDPFCGAGTILIEAAMLAAQIPTGLHRSFAFERTALLDNASWRQIKDEATAAIQPASARQIFGSDRDKGAIEAVQENAARAQVMDYIQVGHASLSDAAWTEMQAHEKGHIITNPPWGSRVGAVKKLSPLYRALGQAIQGLPEGWRGAFYATNHRLAAQVGEYQSAFLTDAGGIKIRAMIGR